MAVTSITNLVPSFPDQFPEQTQNSQPVTGTLQKGNAGNPAVTEDTFISSKQNKFAPLSAQDAGIFQVNQGNQTLIPANNEPAQTGLNAIPKGAPAQAASSTSVGAFSSQTATAQSKTATDAAAQAGAAPGTQTPANPAAAAAAQNQIEALNAALPSLGLTNEEIQQIDRIASLAGNYNPAAYASLVSQFESLAQQAAQQAAPNPGSAAIPGAGAPSNPSVSANGVTYQLQGALIDLSAQKGAENNGANSGQGNAAGLQLSQVQFSLSTNNGQTVQVQAPQQSTNAGTPDLQAPQIVALAG
jgi:hypothetical protein